MRRLLLLLLCFVFICLMRLCRSGALIIKSPKENLCGKNWTMYKDEKCITILEEVGLLNHADAEEACQKEVAGDNQGSVPRLLTVKSEEEQEFINRYLFTGEREVVDHVWLGLTKNSRSSVWDWNDGGELLLTNWAQRSLSEVNLTCVQMETGETMFGVGQWVKVNCKKRNVVVCEKMIPWPLDRVQNTMLAVKRQLATSVVRHDEVFREMGDVRKHQKSITEQITTIIFNQEASEASTKSMNNKIELMEQKINAVTQRNSVMDEQINLLKQVSEVTEQTLIEMKKEIQETKDELSSLNDKVEAVETQIVTITEKIEILEENVIDLQDKNEAETKKIAAVKNEEERKIANLKHGHETHDKLVKNLETKINVIEEKLSDLKHKHSLAVENFDYFKNDVENKFSSFKHKGKKKDITIEKKNDSFADNIAANINNQLEQSGILKDQNEIFNQIIEQSVNPMKFLLEGQITALEQRTKTLEETLGIVETKHNEDRNKNVAFISHTASNNNSPVPGINQGQPHATWQESSYSTQDSVLENAWAGKDGTPHHNSSSIHLVEVSGTKDGKPVAAGTISTSDVVQQDEGETYSQTPKTDAMKYSVSELDVTIKASEKRIAALEKSYKKLETSENRIIVLEKNCKKMAASDIRITVLEKNHQKLEQLITELKQEIVLQISNLTSEKSKVTKEMLSSVKQELQDSIHSLKENLDLKITVLEQRSDVSEQLFTVLKRDTTMKLAALEQKLTGWIQKESQNAATGEEQPAQTVEVHTQEAKASQTESLAEASQIQQTQPQHRQTRGSPEVDNQLCISVPVGFTYLQLPGYDPPNVLWPNVSWTDISTSFAGLFFRVVGGESSSFGEVQEGGAPALEFRNNLNVIDDGKGKNETQMFGNWSSEVFTGNAKLGSTKVVALRFRYKKQEVRCRNTAIKVWVSGPESASGPKSINDNLSVLSPAVNDTTTTAVTEPKIPKAGRRRRN